jgi:outer membrane receptor protein involved in Fe transport
MVAEPQNSGFTFAETKALMMVDLPPGTDPIPNINSYAEMEAAILGLLPSELQDKLRYRVELQNGTYRVENETFAGQVATAAVKAKGFEIDLVTNPTPNWRIMFNLAQQETTQSDSAPKAKVLAETIVGNLQASGLANLRVSPTFNAPETVFNEFNRLVLVPLNGILARDGTISLEQRKWRANLVTNYRFAQSSRFRGFSVGGGIRWQDKVGIGYSQLYSPETGIVPDLSRPFFAPSEWNGDMWFTYERKINERVNWKVQLNFRNLFGDHNDIPVRANPDGSIAAIRIPNDKTWFLTNTFEF